MSVWREEITMLGCLPLEAGTRHYTHTATPKCFCAASHAMFYAFKREEKEGGERGGRDAPSSPLPSRVRCQIRIREILPPPTTHPPMSPKSIDGREGEGGGMHARMQANAKCGHRWGQAGKGRRSLRMSARFPLLGSSAAVSSKQQACRQ